MPIYQGSIHVKNQLMIFYKLTSEPNNWTVQPQRTSFIDIFSFLFSSLRQSIDTLPVKMFGLGQKVLSHLAWSKFRPILAN